MSLMRLLTAGKSLVGGQDPTTRYRMTDPRSMPKFGSGKNPFRTTVVKGEQALAPEQVAAPVSAPASVRAIAWPRGETATPAGVQAPAGCGAEGQSAEELKREGGSRAVVTDGSKKQPAAAKGITRTPASVLRQARSAAPVQAKSGIDHTGAEVKRAGRLSRWTANLKSRLSRTPKRRTLTVLRRAARPPAQGELSLDRIKVVRNDLSDADLEVVPASTPAVEPSADPALTIVPNKGPETTAWGRVATRILSAGKP